MAECWLAKLGTGFLWPMLQLVSSSVFVVSQIPVKYEDLHYCWPGSVFTYALRGSFDPFKTVTTRCSGEGKVPCDHHRYHHLRQQPTFGSASLEACLEIELQCELNDTRT